MSADRYERGAGSRLTPEQVAHARESMSAWADGHPYIARADDGPGCERCGRGPSAPVHRRFLSVAPELQRATEQR